MRRIALSFAFAVLFSASLSAQSTQTSTLPPAPQDPQAVNVLNQALTAGGGTEAIAAITDYTATGNVTYYVGQDVQGTVTIRAKGVGEIRVDETFSNGTWSKAVSKGNTTLKGADGSLLQLPPTTKKLPSSDITLYHAPLFPGGLSFPTQELSSALNNPHYGISYKGIVASNGLSVHDIRVTRVPAKGGPVTPYDAKDYFIDASTFQVVAVQETLPKLVVHQFTYANYSSENGVLIPLSITEQVGSSQTRTIQLTQIGFNSGLQDSVFSLQ